MILPAGGEVRVLDLVLTAIEVREEQYDHKPGHGDVLAATLHVRAAGSPAPSTRDMAAQSDALVRVRSDAGAGGTTWQHYRFVVTGGDRNAVVLAVTPFSRAGSAGGAPLKLDARGGIGAAAGLAFTVLEVVEKFMNDGNTMMRVKLHVRRAGTPAPSAAELADEDSRVTLTSDPGSDTTTWNGFRIDYLGGWRDEVELRIVPPAN
ncbi:hypothetical protein [Nannocystis bainbridge]|uniref:Uncharacterized protein n=1 Tax=Nannocystis bainbridge TaxID=2995303 RepID=A0ABT5E4X1_9BACT|nr:hypothetical protein [Nannocystis bainbridge]MDC0720384.1 hypothetical protein [Nannocystis bainbridge]